MAKTKSKTKKKGFMAKTKTELVVKKDSNTKSKWKRENMAKKSEKKSEKDEKRLFQMFKIGNITTKFHFETFADEFE